MRSETSAGTSADEQARAAQEARQASGALRPALATGRSDIRRGYAANAQREKYIEARSSAESICVYQCGSWMFHVGHVYRADLRQVRNGHLGGSNGLLSARDVAAILAVPERTVRETWREWELPA
jgi:hypothetical protein